MAYQRPMVTVEQNMTVAPTSVERDQPAFIFGPNYELHRYEDSAEKEGTKALTEAGEGYTGVTATFPYPNVADPEAVDSEYTKLFGENVVVELLDPRGVSYSKGEYDGESCGKIVRFFQDGSDSDESKMVKAGSLIRISVSESSDFITKVLAVDDTGIFVEDEPDVDDGSSSSSSSITVTATLVDIVDGVEFAQDLDGRTQWSQSDGGVKVNAGLKAVLRYTWDGSDGDDYTVISADLFIQYRELATQWSDTIHSVTGASSVADMLGAVSPDNPLAMGVYMACLNAATDDGFESPPVYFMATPTDDLEGYNDVLRKASLTDKVYILVPTTQDSEVIKAVESHVVAMSLATVKQWRIAAVSAEIPETVSRQAATMDPQNQPYKATVSGNVFKVVSDADPDAGNPNTAFRSTLVVGDKVKYDGGVYTIKRILNNYMVQVKENVADSDVAKEIEIYHVYTNAETAEVVASTSRHFASRRMLNVFPTVVKYNGVAMSGEFAACAVAGLISATEPQQPITNMPIRGIDDVPMIYSTFNNEELDTMAAGGTFIIAQDLPGDIVYVRHQVTTATYGGNLNTSEMSVTKNVDNISYAFAETFRPYYGKYNVEPGLIAILENLASTLIDQFSGSTSKYGPQLIAEGTEILYVRQNQVFKDHVDVAIRLEVPYPCNRIDIVLTV